MLHNLYADLRNAIQCSFSPQPELIEIDHVCDVKEWMMQCIPPIHDHLKAHQFKFEGKSKGSGTRMYYKQWSTDTFWLPASGIDMLNGSRYIMHNQYVIM